jgi:hypothetical protein
MDSQDSHDALHLALDIAKSRDPPQFSMLASRVFGAGVCALRESVCPRAQNNIFEHGSLYAVYMWRPQPWHIPEEDELSELESLICKPGDSDTQLPATDDGTHYYYGLNDQLHARDVKWYFSATAVAVDFCKSTSKQRYSIVLQ